MKGIADLVFGLWSSGFEIRKAESLKARPKTEDQG
jgi:hypothetical protein